MLSCSPIPTMPPCWVVACKSDPGGPLPPHPRLAPRRPSPLALGLPGAGQEPKAHVCQLLPSGCSPAWRGVGGFPAGDLPGEPSWIRLLPGRPLMLLRNVTETNGLLHTCHLSSGGRHGRQAHADTRLREPGHTGTHTEPAKALRTEVLMQGTHIQTHVHTRAPGLPYTYIYTHSQAHIYRTRIHAHTRPPTHTRSPATSSLQSSEPPFLH